MNSIKRDKLLVQIKQLPSRAEPSSMRDRCAAQTISPRIVFNKMQTPSLRTVLRSDCNQFEPQLTMANPVHSGPVNHESIYVSALIVATVS